MDTLVLSRACIAAAMGPDMPEKVSVPSRFLEEVQQMLERVPARGYHAFGLNIWRYYSIARTGRNASRLATGHESSSINRAVAFYRSLAGIPTDQEPPAAR